MSVRVMALCYECRFLSPSRKAVAVAVADHVDDRGEHAFPSVARLADKTEFSDRSVQYALRDLEAIGLLIVTDKGGKGEGDTKEWRFDMTLLRNLAERNCEIVDAEDADVAPSEGATSAPKGRVRVQPVHGRVQLTTVMGAMVAPEPSLTVINHPGAFARASEEARSPPALHKNARLVLIGDPEWGAWLTFAKTFGAGYLTAFRDEEVMVVYGSKPYSRCPPPDLIKSTSALFATLLAEREKRLGNEGLSDRSKAMSGEAA